MTTQNFTIIFTAILMALIFPGCDKPWEPGQVDIVRSLSGDSDCYARADQPVNPAFPRDLGPHENFKTEWWYYTGNLVTDTGRHFGFQLTFFRQALACDDPPEDSLWRTRQLYFAHFALTDVQNRTFYSAQRMNRGALGIAGARSRPYKVWIDNWTAHQSRPTDTIFLRAKDRTPANGRRTPENMAVDLALSPTKPVIFQGQNGWSKKGDGPSDASYYYSFPGLSVRGQLTLGQEIHQVRGRAWFDHEWSTSALGKEAGGWDWFAFSLTQGPHKGMDIMLCQIRRRDNGPSTFGFGSISFADGRHEILTGNQFSISALAHWTSPRTASRYPAGWAIALPTHDIRLEAAPLVADQEHPHGLSYYEGAIGLKGPKTQGRGYVEMTGYQEK